MPSWEGDRLRCVILTVRVRQGHSGSTQVRQGHSGSTQPWKSFFRTPPPRSPPLECREEAWGWEAGRCQEVAERTHFSKEPGTEVVLSGAVRLRLIPGRETSMPFFSLLYFSLRRWNPELGD